MTAERRAEINRRLFALEHDRQPSEVDEACMKPYTADLNALSRLEEKLPGCRWDIWRTDYGFSVKFHYQLTPGDLYIFVNAKRTEAEARAEAIMQYLESHAESR